MHDVTVDVLKETIDRYKIECKEKFTQIVRVVVTSYKRSCNSLEYYFILTFVYHRVFQISTSQNQLSKTINFHDSLARNILKVRGGRIKNKNFVSSTLARSINLLIGCSTKF